LFHNSNVFGSCIIHILYTGCAKIKKNNSGAKRLKAASFSAFPVFIAAGAAADGHPAPGQSTAPPCQLRLAAFSYCVEARF